MHGHAVGRREWGQRAMPAQRGAAAVAMVSHAAHRGRLPSPLWPLRVCCPLAAADGAADQHSGLPAHRPGQDADSGGPDAQLCALVPRGAGTEFGQDVLGRTLRAAGQDRMHRLCGALGLCSWLSA